MRVLVLVKATEESERGDFASPDAQQEFAAMGDFNEKLVKAGVMLAGEGLKPSSDGVRVAFDAGSTSVIDGPFAETKELVAGFWIWKVGSLQEAVDWIKQAPFRANTIELRPIYEAEDFADAISPELAERESRLRQEASAYLS